MGLWVVAGAYASQYLTDGFVPEWYVDSWPSGRKLAQRLEAADLWVHVEGGWAYHQWQERQPTKEQVEADRKATRARQQRWRDARRDNRSESAVSNGVTDGVTNSVSNGCPVPTRPLKDIPADRPDIESLCTHLADRIAANGSKRPEVTKGWRDAARLLLDKDGHEPAKAKRLIDWCQADSFWRANVLSMPTFRAKYDQLRLVALADFERNGGHVSPDGDLDVDAILGAERFQPPAPPDDIEAGTIEFQQWARTERETWLAGRQQQAREVLARRSA